MGGWVGGWVGGWETETETETEENRDKGIKKDIERHIRAILSYFRFCLFIFSICRLTSIRSGEKIGAAQGTNLCRRIITDIVDAPLMKYMRAR